MSDIWGIIAKGGYKVSITDEQLINWFTYHDNPNNLENYRAIRAAALGLAKLIVASTPVSADQTAAIRKLRECVFTANAAIACGGK